MTSTSLHPHSPGAHNHILALSRNSYGPRHSTNGCSCTQTSYGEDWQSMLTVVISHPGCGHFSPCHFLIELRTPN